jgi:hypothetical protein
MTGTMVDSQTLPWPPQIMESGILVATRCETTSRDFGRQLLHSLCSPLTCWDGI